ncbi:MAG: hypothetical protein Q9219_002772 [cf. Caloplaca sp. 3 TL-2023]
MDLKDLSTNWKKLQATFRSETTQTPKCEASENVLRFQRNGVKRRRIVPRPKPKSISKGTKKTSNVRENSMGIVTSYLKPLAPSASLASWAADNDIPARDLAAAYGTSLSHTSLPDLKQEDRINEGLSDTADAGKYISMDCEMVGVGPTPENDSFVARVSIVNYYGRQVYDSFIQPKEQVTDYRTSVSGITPKLLKEARPLEMVQADIIQLLDGRILIGHSVKKDLEALFLGHPKKDIRDTSRYPPYRTFAGGNTPSLKKLAKQLLEIDIQSGEHSSIEDARAAMSLFRKDKEGFEREHQRRWGPLKTKGQGAIGVGRKRSKIKKRRNKNRK